MLKFILLISIFFFSFLPSVAQTSAQDSIKKLRVLAGQNQMEGEIFLKENGKRPNVKTTYTGLQYEILKESQSKKSPSAFKNVVINYTGKFVNGEIFDQGDSAVFNLQDVIKGFSQGVQYMTIGSRYILYIPYYLAYGAKGFGNIPPCKTLIFDIELLEIKK